MAKEKKEPYNPLDKINLGKSVANAILEQSLNPLPPDGFEGAGIYAIYYRGPFEPYQRLVEFHEREVAGWPIYVGKAIPSGGRKGLFSKVAKGKSLYNRLKKHAQSIIEAENLELSDFQCRFLTIDSIWIPLGEQLLIDRYKPLWNSIIDGFGNNDPGQYRYSGRMSDWDKVHPGRVWTKRMKTFLEEYPDTEAVIGRIKEHLAELS